jgi:hypothetical protein
VGKKKATADELVDEALLKLAVADGPMRLSGKGDPPALFTSAKKEVTAILKDRAAALVAEAGSGKNAPVQLTAAGFERIAAAVPDDKVGPVAKRLAEAMPVGERVAFLHRIVGRTPLATAELVPVLEAALAEEKVESEKRAAEAAKRREAETASLAALKRWEAAIEAHKQARIAALRRELAAEGADADEPLPATPKPRAPTAPPPAPTTPEEKDFRRNVARRLVSAWVEAWDAKKPDAREYLESAIWNVAGFRQVGQPEEQTKFDGRYHEGAAGLFPGDAARIVRPGWVLEEEDDREYVVLKALLAK